MLKYGLFLSLLALSTACSDHDHRGSKSPTPAVTPTAVPTPPPTLTPDIPKLQPIAARSVDLDKDFGFKAAYSKLLIPRTLFPDATSSVLVSKYRIQVRKESDREILDCRFNDEGFLDVKLIQDGKLYPTDAFLWINCLILQNDVLPVRNIKDLCDVYGCTEENLGAMSTIKVQMEPTLWIEKERGIRVDDSRRTRLLEVSSDAPTDEDFSYAFEN